MPLHVHKTHQFTSYRSAKQSGMAKFWPVFLNLKNANHDGEFSNKSKVRFTVM